ncbi:MAG: Trk system potassium transporter TrkA [Solirubrobacterales bacterium]
MRVIVVGAGRVGRTIASRLSEEDDDVTIIDRQASRCELVTGAVDAFVHQGNGASPTCLREMDAGSAGLVVGATAFDEVNVLAAGVAKRLGAERVVARVRGAGYQERDARFVHEEFDIDFIVDPYRAAAEDIAEAIQLPGAVHAETFAGGSITVAEAILSDSSPLANTTISDYDAQHEHRVIGLSRDGDPHIVNGDETLKSGDRIVIAAPTAHIGEAVAEIAGRSRPAGQVAIFGGTPLAVHLAERLIKKGLEITLMESDADRARTVAERLPKARVLEATADEQTIREYGIDTFGAFVACTDNEQTNLVAAVHAKKDGAGLAVAVIEREDLLPLVDALHIDGAFSPRLIAAEAILKFARGREVKAMHMMPSGFEMFEVTADEGSEIVGREVKGGDGHLKGTVIAALLRDGEVIVPRESQTIKADDCVLLAGEEGAVTRVEQAFAG